VHGVDTRVLAGDAGACRAYEKPIVGRVSVSATPQKRSNGVKHPRRNPRNPHHHRLLNARIRLFNLLFRHTRTVQQLSLINK
ncbi:hypothetical protein ACVGXX_00290, partial [Enterobacter intestinihominis]